MNFVTNKNKLLRFFRYLADRIAGGLFKLSNGRAYGTNVVVCRLSSVCNGCIATSMH